MMREPCYSVKQLKESDDPHETKWKNCRYDGEPVAIDDEAIREDFKKLCAPLYSETMKLCCGPEQLRIIKKDFSVAKAVSRLPKLNKEVLDHYPNGNVLSHSRKKIFSTRNLSFS